MVGTRNYRNTYICSTYRARQGCSVGAKTPWKCGYWAMKFDYKRDEFLDFQFYSSSIQTSLIILSNNNEVR